MIRSSLTVVPRRLPILWGKLAVFAGVVFLTVLVASFASFFVGQALLGGQHVEASLTDTGALRSVFGAALYLTVAGVTALAGAVLLDGTFGIAHPLTPWTGFAVMCGFAVVLTGLAARRLRRADA